MLSDASDLTPGGFSWDEHVVTQGLDVIYRKRGWRITATWPERAGSREIVTLLGVQHLSVPVVLVQAPKRLNVLSTSAVNGISATMRKIVPDGVDEMLQHVCADLLEWYRKGTATSWPDPSRPTVNRGWVLYPIWRKVDATGIAASREHFKSLLAHAIVLEVGTGVEVLRGNTRPQAVCKPLYVDYESDEPAFTERLAALCRGADIALEPHIGYRAMRLPLSDAALGLRDEIASEGYGCVVVDSMSAASGGSMVEDESVNAFWDAVTLLGVPTLVLAHKSDENQRLKRPRFFGSTMSENRVRVAWSVERSRNSSEVVWSCFKDNNGRMAGHARLGFHIEIDNEGSDESEVMWAARVGAVDPDTVAVELPASRTMADELVMLLSQGPLGVKDLAEMLGKGQETVRSALRRNVRRFRQDSSGRWGTM